MTVHVAAFASGTGSNVQALLDYFGDGGPGQGIARVVTVISDRPAPVLGRAERGGAVPRLIEVRGRSEDDVADEMFAALEEHGVGLITLAGYLRLVPLRIVRRFAGRMLNVHPALLPAFGGKGMYGLRIHRAVLERGCRVSGVTVHYVNEAYDEGPILCQWPVPVLPDDTPESLAARVLGVEHKLYPAAVEVVARGLLGQSAGAGRGADFLRPAPPAFHEAFALNAGVAPRLEDVRRALGLP